MGFYEFEVNRVIFIEQSLNILTSFFFFSFEDAKYVVVPVSQIWWFSGLPYLVTLNFWLYQYFLIIFFKFWLMDKLRMWRCYWLLWLFLTNQTMFLVIMGSESIEYCYHTWGYFCVLGKVSCKLMEILNLVLWGHFLV